MKDSRNLLLSKNEILSLSVKYFRNDVIPRNKLILSAHPRLLAARNTYLSILNEENS